MRVAALGGNESTSVTSVTEVLRRVCMNGPSGSTVQAPCGQENRIRANSSVDAQEETLQVARAPEVRPLGMVWPGAQGLEQPDVPLGAAGGLEDEARE